MNFSPSLFAKKFLNDPFGTLDELDLSYAGFQFNVLRNDEKLRKAIFETFFIWPLLAWILLGTDSTVDQLTNVIVYIPQWLMGNMTFNQLLAVYIKYYGLGTHWSAAVIYSACLIGVSKHLRDNLQIKNSLNLALTCGIVALSIATFEFFWQICYAIFQHQPWVLYLQFPQARILIQNSLFLLVGILVLVGLNWKAYTININWQSLLCITATLSFTLLWIFYGHLLPTTTLTVGQWTSSPTFPQTMYTIQTDPTIGIGQLYYVANNGIHLTNNLAKIFWTLSFYLVFKLKRK